MPRRSYMLLHLPRRAKAITASIVASAADLATLVLLVQRAGVEPGIAAALGCIVGGALNFWMSRHWVFAEGHAYAAHDAGRQLALYALLVVAGSAVLSGALVHVATATLGAPVVVAKGAAAALVFLCWTYPISTHVVFPHAHTKELAS